MARKMSIDAILRRREAEDLQVRNAIFDIDVQIAELKAKRQKLEALVSPVAVDAPAINSEADGPVVKDWQLVCADCGAKFWAGEKVKNECPRCYAAPFEEMR